MYEAPCLIPVGEAKEIILGIASYGSDLDGSWIGADFEYVSDDGPGDIEE